MLLPLRFRTEKPHDVGHEGVIKGRDDFSLRRFSKQKSTANI